MEPVTQFEKHINDNISRLGDAPELFEASLDWMIAVAVGNYTYNYSWLGRPIIQYPQDIVAMQELIWKTKPDLIIETGIAHGGSLVLSASMLALLDYAEAVERGELVDPKLPKRHVLGIDIDIREHNLEAITNHPFSNRIDMIKGSSISTDVVDEVKARARDYNRVLVCLDSNHTHDHVLSELEAYAPLTSIGSYCIVFDTLIEDMPEHMLSNRPWGKGNNPKTAVHEYMRQLNEEGRHASDGARLEFELDKKIEKKLLITVAPDGYLRRVR